MLITIFIEVFIGIVFVWFFLALAVMAIQEWWAAFSKTRATSLQKTIRAMLENPEQYANALVNVESIVGQLYQHPMIQSLSEPLRKAAKTPEKGLLKKVRSNWVRWRSGQQIQYKQDEASIPRWLPSYIPTRTFSLALFDIITTAGTDNSAIQQALADWQTLINGSIASLQQSGTLPDEVKRHWNTIKPTLSAAIAELQTVVEPQLSQAELTNKLNVKVAELQANHPEIATALASLKPQIEKLPEFLLSAEVVKGIANLAAQNPAAQKVLAELQKRAMNLAAQGEKTIEVFRKNVETWFDDTMERASGWYKRKAQILAFVFGVGVAVVLNVDSLAVVTTLYREPTLRAAMVAEAGSTVQGAAPTTGTKVDEVGAKLQELGLPVGWHFANKTQCNEIAAQGNLALQVGATRCIIPGDTPEGIEIDGVGQGILFWVLKVAGWALSGAMAAQGAPFWFDIMKKMINVRSSGSNPTEAQAKPATQAAK